MKASAKESIKFHVSANDYFVNIATRLNLIKEVIIATAKELNDNAQVLGEMKDELVFLQKEYKILKKTKRKGD